MGKKTMYTPCTSRTTTLAELLADLVERGHKEALYIHEAILNTGEKVDSLEFFDTKSEVTLGHPLEQPNTLVMDLVKISEGESFLKFKLQFSTKSLIKYSLFSLLQKDHIAHLLLPLQLSNPLQLMSNLLQLYPLHQRPLLSVLKLTLPQLPNIFQSLLQLPNSL